MLTVLMCLFWLQCLSQRVRVWPCGNKQSLLWLNGCWESPSFFFFFFFLNTSLGAWTLILFWDKIIAHKQKTESRILQILVTGVAPAKVRYCIRDRSRLSGQISKKYVSKYCILGKHMFTLDTNTATGSIRKCQYQPITASYLQSYIIINTLLLTNFVHL